MVISRHKTDYWIKNNSVDVSIKDICGQVDVHWHEFYEIELILEGAGIYNVDGIDYEIEKGSLFFMSPSSFHHINFTENTKLINFMFTLEACDMDFLCGIFDSVPHILINLFDFDVDFIHTLAKDTIKINSVKYQSAVLNCVLGKIQNLCASYTTQLKDSRMQYAILYIQNHFKENITLKQAAEIANYSPNYFGNKFKEYTGVTFKEYIMELKFSFARKMLKKTNLTVSEICYNCGFSDFSNFMFYFKKRYGMTPKQYRDSLTHKKIQS